MCRDTFASSCTDNFFVSAIINPASMPEEDRSKSELLTDVDCY